MKRTIFFIAIIGITINSSAQQVQLKGLVSVQNSKTNTGQTQYVKNAEVAHTNSKNAKTKDVTGDDGKFTLNIQGVQPNTQTSITVTLSGAYSDYVLVNERELQDITLGRITPVSVYICKKSELEERRAEMVKINMKKYRDQIKLLQEEREKLQDNHDYSNARYAVLESQIESLNKAMPDRYSLIKEWAESLTAINLDEADENYVKAYHCFANGHLDSINYYLPDVSLKQQKERLLRQQEEGQQKIEMGKKLTEAGQQDIEITKARLADNAKSWMLKAKAAALENKYELAIDYFKEAINSDPLNMDNLFEFANYLYSIREYAQAEQHFQTCLEQYQLLEKENPNVYLSDAARTLNRLAILHSVVNEHQKSLKEHNEALEIRRKLANENANYLPDLAATLNNLAALHRVLNEHQKALEKYEESLKIRRKLAAESPIYLSDLAQTLNNLGVLHHRIFKEYAKAEKEYNEALEIRKKLAAENPKDFLADVGTTLDNLASLHLDNKNYPKSLQEYEEALAICRKLVAENPKTYLPDVAKTLNNAALLHWDIKEYSNAKEKYEESLAIYRKLAKENPKAYSSNMALTLSNLALVLTDIKEYDKSLELHKEALEIFKQLAKDNPQVYLADAAITLGNIAEVHQFVKEYPKALEEHKEALEIFKQLAKENLKVYSANVAECLNNLSYYYLFTQEYAQSEQHAREALKWDATAVRGKIYIAHSLLLRNRFSEAEKIYKDWLQTNNDHSLLLDSLEKLEEVGVIPKEREEDVDRIKIMVK